MPEPDPAPALQPAQRFDWERILRRIRIPAPVRGTGLLLATYADIDGGRVHPGIQRLTTVSGVNEKTIRRHLLGLKDFGLIELTRRGNRRWGQADEYRLTVPADALQRFAMLDPDEILTLDHRTPVSGKPRPSEDILDVHSGHSAPSLPDTGVHPPNQLHQPQTKPEPHLEKVSNERVTRDATTDRSGLGSTDEPRPSAGYLAATAALNGRRTG